MFLGFGEVMARIAPSGHRRWRQSLPGQVEVTWGGGEANVCASLALFGQPVRYVTALPRHDLAASLMATMMGLGVDTRSVLWRDEGRLGLYFVERGANQRGSTVVYDRENSAVSLAAAEEYDFEASLQDVTWLHLSGITPAISEQASEANLAIAKLAKSRGISVSCDLNFRQKLWRWQPGTEAKKLARQTMAQLLPFVDLVIGNEGDAADVLGIQPTATDVEQGHINVQAYEDVARQIVSQYANVSRVAITLRESVSADFNRWGAMLYEAAGDQAWFAPLDNGAYQPYEIRDIVDRVGAGDSFAAGLLHALHSESHSEPGKAIAFAVAASCLKHSVAGDFNFVSESEVSALVGGNATGRVQR